MSDTIPYIPAKYVGANRGDPTLIVIHSMEYPEKPEGAEWCAKYFQNPVKPSSAHICVDNNSAVRCVPDHQVAYAAPGANHNGKHYELSGFARQTREQWLDDYGRAQIVILARHIFEDCKKYGIPCVYRTAEDLRNGLTIGITTHNEVSKAFKRSTHWDPGPGYPMDTLIFLVAALLNPPHATHDPPPPPPAPGPAALSLYEVLALAIFFTKIEAAKNPYRRGDGKQNQRQDGVKVIQAGLQKAGQWIAVDGEFGPYTEKHVKHFQAQQRLTVDGAVGPVTMERLFPG